MTTPETYTLDQWIDADNDLDDAKERIAELEAHIKTLEQNIIELRTRNDVDDVLEVPFLFTYEDNEDWQWLQRRRNLEAELRYREEKREKEALRK